MTAEIESAFWHYADLSEIVYAAAGDIACSGTGTPARFGEVGGGGNCGMTVQAQENSNAQQRCANPTEARLPYSGLFRQLMLALAALSIGKNFAQNS